MNTDTLKGSWKQLKGEARARWGKITDDDLQQIDGNFERLVGAIQRAYGKGREEAEQDARNWEPGDFSNS